MFEIFNSIIFKMMRSTKFEYVCQVDTVYTLFLYLLLFPQNFDITFFIFGCGIPDLIRKQFVGNSFIIKKKQGGVVYSCLNIIRGWILLPYIYWKHALKDKISYGHDHLIFSSYVIGQSQFFYLLEDGTANYKLVDKLVLYKKEHFWRWRIKSTFNQLRGVISMPWGGHPKIKKIYLSGLLELPIYYHGKIELFSLHDRWNDLLEKQRSLVFQLLCVNDVLNQDMCYDVLLLTQCFSEGGRISERGKIMMYKDILSKYQHESLKICLKPHPREKTKYEIIFPSIQIIPSYIPFELLNLASNVSFKKVITISSTAIYSLKGNIDRIILGSQYMEKYKNL